YGFWQISEFEEKSGGVGEECSFGINEE
ncbi:MAG: hypothetical protein ACD_18C00049G0001, partial [uncultured bacterium]